MSDHVKPMPPPGRMVCELCGELLPGGLHRGWLCRLSKLIERLTGKK